MISFARHCPFFTTV